MRIPLVCVFVIAVSPIAMAAKTFTRTLTVAELEQEMTAHRGGWDGSAAHFFSNLKLSERISNERLEPLLRKLAGTAAHDALIAIADESEFQSVPPDELSSRPAPEAAEQQRLIALTANYVDGTMQRWPNFSAVRSVTRFEGTATAIPNGLQDALTMNYGRRHLRSPLSEDWECPGNIKLDHTRLAPIEKKDLTVVYRAGHELHTLDDHAGEFACMRNGVSTWDEFGELRFFLSLARSFKELTWSHWEKSPEGDLAVFHGVAAIYELHIPHATVGPPRVEIEGDIAVNPADGSVRRLVMKRRWREARLAKEYDTAMEYGPVNINGATYFCPMRRIAIYRSPMLRPRDANKEMEKTYRRYELEESPQQEYLNDVRFAQYQPEMRRGAQTTEARAAMGSQ